MQRRKGAFFLGFLLTASLGSAQTAVWNAATIPTDPSFSSVYTTVHGVPVGEAGYEADLTMNQLWAQIGQTFATPRNWNGSNGFSLAVENTEAFPVSLGFKIDLANGSPMTSIFEVPAGERVRFFIDNSGFSTQATGMDRPLPIFQGYYKHSLVFTPQNLSQVSKWSIYYRNEAPARLKISSINGHTVNLNYNNTVDHFGQLSYQTWTGKAISDLDLTEERDREGVELALNPGGTNTLGSTTLGSVTATGKWRTLKGRNGKTYIVTPAGKLFWSVGATSVTDSNPTIVQGREHMFQSLPIATDPEAAFLGTYNGLKTFDFTKVNLSRKHGAGWQGAWRTRAAQRVKSWGLNTLGSGSDLAIMEDSNIPAVLTVTTKDFPVRLAVDWNFWGDLPDPHHSAFSAWIANRYRTMLQWYCRNGRLMGVIVDGENAWAGPEGIAGHFQIPLAALKAGKTQPAKQVFLAQLRTKYPTVQALNSAWRTNYSSWSYMYDNAIVPNSTNFTDAQLQDFSKFLNTFAAKYYHGVKVALQDIGVNCLFLGSKDAATWTPAEVHEQAAKYVDVISVTYYGKVDDIDWNYLNGLKKPVLIAEFSFASNDRGPSASTNWIGDLQFDADRRAAEAKKYLDKALTMPNIVGAHWYSYLDNVLSGRTRDAQNYAVGLVDITDRPYGEMVEVFRTFTSGMYSQRGFW